MDWPFRQVAEGGVGWSVHPLLHDPGLSSPLKLVPSSPLGGLAQPVLSVGVHRRMSGFLLIFIFFTGELTWQYK